jgi:hypothetical protein
MASSQLTDEDGIKNKNVGLAELVLPFLWSAILQNQDFILAAGGGVSRFRPGIF